MERICKIDLSHIELRAFHQSFSYPVTMVMMVPGMSAAVTFMAFLAAMAFVSLFVAVALAAFVTAAGAIVAACAMLVITAA